MESVKYEEMGGEEVRTRVRQRSISFPRDARSSSDGTEVFSYV